MSVAVANDLFQAVERLAPGMALRVDAVSWDDYENLLADLGEGSHVRVFYDRGRMEIMSPVSMHERPKNVIHDLISALREELNIDIESLGSTTYKEEMKRKGAEPDDSFYIQHADSVIGQTVNLDLAYDPPPDLVIEIDRSNSSLNKFPIYAGLGVSELWRVHDHQVRFWVLTGEDYEESEHSRAFPFLTSGVISRFLGQGILEGSRKTTQAFRQWVRRQTDPE